MSTIKYQVFISSTYEDLEHERDEVIKAVLEMGHIPVGMEMFSAADDEQWKLITRQIEQSDYYIVIIAHRYGSVIGKRSYTEKEYDYAIQEGIPVIGFIIEDTASWPKDRVEADSNKTACLIRFKKKVKRKLVGFWSSKEELGGKVSRSLIKLITTNPRPGWIRTSETSGPEVISEMSRLSSENARLNSENVQIRKQLEESLKIDSSYLSQGDDQVDIEFYFYYEKSKKFNKFYITWNSLFLEIGKNLLKNNTESSVHQIIAGVILKEDKFLNMSNKDYFPVVQEESILKIKTQFIALGYIDIEIVTMPSNGRDNVFSALSSGSMPQHHPHWVLTLLGKRKLVELLAVRRGTE